MLTQLSYIMANVHNLYRAENATKKLNSSRLGIDQQVLKSQQKNVLWVLCRRVPAVHTAVYMQHINHSV